MALLLRVCFFLYFSSYVGDDDSTTLAELVKQTPYKLQKYSDIIHIKRSLSTRLYNLS